MEVSLVLSIVGTVTGVTALVWQAVMWHRSGPIVTAEAELERINLNECLFRVTARNLGRSPVSVMAITLGDFKESDSEFIRRIEPTNEIKAPCRLEAGSAESWIIAVPSGKSASTVVINVILANKKSIRLVKTVVPGRNYAPGTLVFFNPDNQTVVEIPARGTPEPPTGS